MYYSGREPQYPVTTACPAYSGAFLWQSVWSYDTYVSSFETLSCVGNIDRASQQVIIDENQLGYSCILKVMVGVLSRVLGTGKQPFDNLEYRFCLLIAPGFHGEDVLCLMFLSLTNASPGYCPPDTLPHPLETLPPLPSISYLLNTLPPERTWDQRYPTPPEGHRTRNTLPLQKGHGTRDTLPHGTRDSLPCGETDTCENITFPCGR